MEGERAGGREGEGEEKREGRDPNASRKYRTSVLSLVIFTCVHAHIRARFCSRACGGASGAGVGADVEEARGHGPAGAEDVASEREPTARVCAHARARCVVALAELEM